MRLCLQIFGELRTFEKCLDDILYFIDYYNKIFDVFILTQKNSESYSEEKIDILKNKLGNDNIKLLCFIEDFPKDIIETEKNMIKDNNNLHKKFCLKHGINYFFGKFNTQQYFRKFLINEKRKEYEQKNNIVYDIVVRTRLDIGFNKEKIKFNYSSPFFSYDIIAIGSPDIINKEAEFGLVYPYIPKKFYNEESILVHKDFNFFPELVHYLNDKWLFSPELNLKAYLFFNYYKDVKTSIEKKYFIIKR